jgi:hypothetical protein
LSKANEALSAILFLYEHVLDQPLDRVEGVVRARRPTRLPVVLTVDEVYGRVELPHALARKYPNANREWCWQFVFPQEGRWRNGKTTRTSERQ